MNAKSMLEITHSGPLHFVSDLIHFVSLGLRLTQALDVPLDSPDLLSDALASITAEKPHDKGNTTDYESAVKHTYPIIIGWNGNHTNGAAGVQSGDMTEMVCLRANKTAKGSQEVDLKRDDDDSAASQGPLAATWVVMAGMAFAALL